MICIVLMEMSITIKWSHIASWSNGNSTDFDSVVLGSNPSGAAKF